VITRRDVHQIDPRAEQRVLATHGLTAGDLIGEGTEARVYALSSATVLKIYADPRQRASLDVLQDFYGCLQADGLPFELPLIHEIRAEDGLLVVVERRIAGTPMAAYADGRLGLEEVYLDTVIDLSTVLVDPPLGRIMLLSRDYDDVPDWNRFITALLDNKLPDVRPHLIVDVPDFDSRVSMLRARFAGPYAGAIRLVHGDLCPGNILMHDPARTSGIIDFGTLTMAGDPAFDLASACVYFDMYGPERVAVRDRLLAAAAARSTSASEERGTGRQVDDCRVEGAGRALELLTAYVLVVALVTCDLYPEPGVATRAGGHYRWAADILRDGRYWSRIMAARR
jgi:hypothetical protein